MGLSFRSLAIAATAGALLVASVVIAMTVQPVVVDLQMTGRGTSAPLRVENNGPNPLPVEIRIVETDFTPNSVRPSSRESDDIMAFPPQAIIPPGETQVFRLQYVGDPASDISRHYYAEVSQLPVELPEGQSAIQILYNFQVMVNASSSISGPPALSIDGAGVVQNDAGANVIAFTVSNASRNYGYLSAGSLTIIQRNAEGGEIKRNTLSSNDIQQTIGFGLIGPTTSRRFVTTIPAESADASIEASLTMPRRR